MSTTAVNPDASRETLDIKLEVVTLPVSDVDRAKRFFVSIPSASILYGAGRG